MSAKRVPRREFLRLAALGGAGIAAAGCGATATPQVVEKVITKEVEKVVTKEVEKVITATPIPSKKGGTLNYAHLGDFVGFESHRLHAVSFPMFNLLYNSLVVLDKNLRPQPELAESWQFSDDSRTLTLNLRQGVKFHSGREMTSEDVKFNIENIQNPESAANARPLSLVVEKIETPDTYTVVLKLSRVTPNIFDLLDLTYVMESESLPDIAKKGVGTGPFMLEEWRPGDVATFTRFDEYFKPGLPLLDKVLVRVLADPASMIVGLENGSLDIIERFPAQEAARLSTVQGLKVSEVFTGHIADILINVRNAPFDNKLARQAISYAVNRQRMIDVAMGGIGKPWCVPFPEASVAYNAEVAAGCQYDLEKGRSLLEEAGYGDGLEFEILASTAVLPASGLQAQVWQADLAEMGVTAHIADVEAADYFERHMNGKFEVAMHQFRGANRDPDSLFLSVFPWYTKDNFSGYESPEYTRLVGEAGSTVEVEKRKELYKELGQLIVDEAFVLCIGPAMSLYGFQDRVQGLSWNVEGFPVFEHIVLV